MALFYFVFEGNFPSTSPRGAYIWRGDLTGGFLCSRFGGRIFGGAYFRNFTVVSKVIIIACDHLVVSKMPKKRRKNEENRLFFPKPGFRQSWQKSLGQHCNIQIILSFLGSHLKQCIFFEICLQFSLPPTLYKVETQKILDTRVQHCLWGEGFDLCELENAPEMQKCPKIVAI